MSSHVRKVKVRSHRREAPTLKSILKNRQKRIRLVLLLSGIFLVLFALSWPKVKEPPPQPTINSQGEVTSFSAEPVKVDEALLKERSKKDKEKLPPVRIIIPELGIDLPVKTAQVVKGFWEVFSDAAGFGIGSAYPEEEGNQVIFAHARQGMFLPLKDAKLGQNVVVFTKDKYYSYTISDIKEVLPSQIEVIAPAEEAVLTLYTCSGFADSKRLIVVAKRLL